MTIMQFGRPSARRCGIAHGSDTGSEDGYPTVKNQTLMFEEAEQLERLRQMQMADLSSDRRDEMTASDYRGSKHANIRVIMAGRDCNQEGTEASERVAKHRAPLAQWSNFGNTDIAKRDAGELLTDIAGGQTHRLNTKVKLAAEAAALGRGLRVDDTYDDRPRRGGIPSTRLNRGGSHAAANDRGNFSGGRGGGNAGRGQGRVALAPSNRPLDPAVDPDRFYGYKERGPRFGSGTSKTAQRKSTATMVNNTVKVSPSAPAGMGKAKAAKEKSLFLESVAPALTATQKTQLMSTKSKAGGSSSRLTVLFNRPPGPPLADSNSFMAAARDLFALGSSQSGQPAASTLSFAGMADSNKGLLASKYANPTAPAASKEKSIHRLAREEFRDPDLSPAELTDALPSTGQLSMTSPSVESVTVDSQAVVGLGISITGNEEFLQDKQDSFGDGPSSGNPDLMDIEIPVVKEDVLVFNRAPKAPAEEMVSISKAELEQWTAIKALMQAGDTTGLMKHLTFESPTEPPKASVLTQPMKVPFPIQPTKASVPKDSVDVANGYAVKAGKIDNIIGNKKNWPKSVATQTTPSLAASKWASGPNFTVPIPQKPNDQGLSSLPTIGVDPRKPSLITISSTSSSSDSGSVEHITTQTINRNNEPTTKAKTTVNPFMPRGSSLPNDDVVLDYGEPAKLKSKSISTASKPAKSKSTAGARNIAEDDLQAQRERVKADMEDQLGIPAGPKQQKSKPAQVKEDRIAGAQMLDQMRASSSSNVQVTKLPTAPPRHILKPKAPSTSATLRSGSVRAGLAVSKWATTQSSPPVKPASTTSNGLTAQSTPSVNSALTTSKWATAQPTYPLKSVSTLRDRSPNKSSHIKKDLGGSKTNCVPLESPREPDSPIFGDARVVSRLPYTASSAKDAAIARFPRPRKSTAIKHTAPGAGYDWLVRDMAVMNVGSASLPTASKSAEASRAVNQAKGIAEQFEADEGDSTDSEL